MTNDYQDAIDAIRRITVPLPNDVLLIIAASKAQLGDLDAARAEMAQFSQNDPSGRLRRRPNATFAETATASTGWTACEKRD